MDPVVTVLRDLLARAEAGELAGVAYTAHVRGGGVSTGFAGDFGARIVQLVDANTGAVKTIRGPGQ